jgi:type I toxin-antitoxin system toxin SymE
MAVKECKRDVPMSFDLITADTPDSTSVSKEVRFLTVCRGNPGPRIHTKSELGIVPPVPLLRVQGQWMEEAGFEIGRRVRVRVAPGRLVFEVD